MADTRQIIQKIAMVSGLTLLVVVIGLLAFLYSPAGQDQIEVPYQSLPMDPGHNIYACRDAPKEVFDNLNRATAFSKAHGTILGDVIVDECSKLCNFDGRMVPCHPGAITVALRDTAFDDDHCGETLSEIDVKTHKILWTTVLMPERCYAPYDGPRFPKEAYAIALTHEISGHAEGRGHTKTTIVKGLVAEKSGELMNASLLKGGWGDAGW